MSHFRSFGLAALVMAAMAVPSSAATLSYSGNFTNDNDVVQISFTLTDTVFVSFQTFGYGGGVNGAGQVILPGGFEPTLQLFFATTGDIASGTMYPGAAPDPCGPRIPDPNRANLCLDVFSQVSLNAGSYILAITQNPNVTAGNNLSAGFIYDLDPNFATGFQGVSSGLPGDSHWALDITVSPEPGAALLMAPALLLIGVIRRRRKN